MNKIFENFKKTDDYIVLKEIFNLKRWAFVILFILTSMGIMYGTLELWLIYRFGL